MVYISCAVQTSEALKKARHAQMAAEEKVLHARRMAQAERREKENELNSIRNKLSVARWVREGGGGGGGGREGGREGRMKEGRRGGGKEQYDSQPRQYRRGVCTIPSPQ